VNFAVIKHTATICTSPKTKQMREIKYVPLPYILRETIRVLYYPDIEKNDGLKLADYTIRKVSGRTPEELAELVLQKEVKDK
jgi:hypothetical protein